MKLFRTMAGRVFLILLGGVIVSTLASLWLADTERQRTLGQIRLAHNADRVAQLVSTLDALPPSDRPPVLAGAAVTGVAMALGQPLALPPGAEADPLLAEALTQRLGDRSQTAVWRWPCSPPERAGRGFRGDRPERQGVCRAVSLSLTDGTAFTLTLRPQAAPPRLLEARGVLSWLGFFTLCLALLAYFVARMATRPLRRLADAAANLGYQMDSPPLPITGPEEVRHAASAFNAMQERIRHYVAERLRMLAAVTHDLQTPLTRLRLRLEKVADEELRERLIADLAAMQNMVREGLDLVRTLDAPLPLAPLDLHSLVDSLCLDAAEAGQDVRLEETAGGAPLLVRANPESLRRCLGNLLDNAAKYGGKTRVYFSHKGRTARIIIRDNGPGIPEDKLELVFEPFSRLETSRSRNTGGTGLGLTIAREIARRHGGSLWLSNHPAGGLEAVLELPLAE